MVSSPSMHVVVLIDVALVEIFEAEIGAEEPRRPILQRDPPVALDRRRPHPLVGGAVGMVHDQQRHALDLGRRREPDDRLALAVRAEALVRPALLGDLAAGVERSAAGPRSAATSTVVRLCASSTMVRALVVPAPSRTAGLARARAATDARQRQRDSATRCGDACAYSYSSASTSDPRTADSAGQSAATNAAPEMIGTSAEHGRQRKLVVEPHAGDVAMHDLAARRRD